MKLSLYCDASIRKVANRDRSFCGGYIADEEGKILFQFWDYIKEFNYDTGGISKVEAHAVKLGIENLKKILDSKDIKYDNVKLSIYTDSLNCVRIFQEMLLLPKDLRKKQKVTLYKNIRNISETLENDFSQVMVSHVPREKNKMADFLTHYAKWNAFDKINDLKSSVKSVKAVCDLVDTCQDFTDLYENMNKKQKKM